MDMYPISIRGVKKMVPATWESVMAGDVDAIIWNALQSRWPDIDCDQMAFVRDFVAQHAPKYDREHASRCRYSSYIAKLAVWSISRVKCKTQRSCVSVSLWAWDKYGVRTKCADIEGFDDFFASEDNPEHNMCQSSARQALVEAVGTLPDREQDIFVARVLRDELYKTIGERHGICGERARQIFGATCEKLREKLAPQREELL